MPFVAVQQLGQTVLLSLCSSAVPSLLLLQTAKGRFCRRCMRPLTIACFAQVSSFDSLKICVTCFNPHSTPLHSHHKTVNCLPLVQVIRFSSQKTRNNWELRNKIFFEYYCFCSGIKYCVTLFFISLVEELKNNNADFPDVRSGIYVHEVVPNSPSHRYVEHIFFTINKSPNRY